MEGPKVMKIESRTGNKTFNNGIKSLVVVVTLNLPILNTKKLQYMFCSLETVTHEKLAQNTIYLHFVIKKNLISTLLQTLLHFLFRAALSSVLLTIR